MQASLLVREGPLQGSEFPLYDAAITLVGRAGSNHVILRDRRVSAIHCLLAPAGKEGMFVLVDVRSKSGLRVNGADFAKGHVHVGDVVEVGPFELEVVPAHHGISRPAPIRPSVAAPTRFEFGRLRRGKGLLLPAGSTTVIGRAPYAHIRVDHRSVSDYHCVVALDPTDQGCMPFLIDLRSSQRTFVAGRPVHRKHVLPGDEIILGRTRFEVRRLDVPRPAATPRPRPQPPRRRPPLAAATPPPKPQEAEDEALELEALVARPPRPPKPEPPPKPVPVQEAPPEEVSEGLDFDQPPPEQPAPPPPEEPAAQDQEAPAPQEAAPEEELPAPQQQEPAAPEEGAGSHSPDHPASSIQHRASRTPAPPEPQQADQREAADDDLGYGLEHVLSNLETVEPPQATRPEPAESFEAPAQPQPPALPGAAALRLLDQGPQDYQDYYRFREPPFANTTDPKVFYHSQCHWEAFTTLNRWVETGPPLAVLFGEHGCGKTFVAACLARRLDLIRPRPVVVCPDRGATRRDEIILAAALTAAQRYDLPAFRGRDPLEVWRATMAHIRRRNALVVLLVDDAHGVPERHLQELADLADEPEIRPAVRILLAGEERLRELVAVPPLAHHLGVSCYLSPLEADEVAAYMGHRLSLAAGNDREPLFTRRAAELVATYSGGIPRLINNVADAALRYACRTRKQQVSRHVVAQAIEELVEGDASG
ncbi:MAG: FHA domain-containing protein [Candidatus Brocadiia bacterium]